MDNGGAGGGSKADAAAAAEAVAETAVMAEAAATAEAAAAAADGKPELCFETSADVSWQLARDADEPDGKMKNTRKFGFSEYILRTRNR